MGKIAAAVIGIALLIFLVTYGSAAAVILKIREVQKREDAGEWQETDGAGREKKGN